MKGRDRKENRGPPTGTRTGPRAKAKQERGYGNPYEHAERPDRRPGPPRERLRMAPSGGIRLDPDVARVFHDSESVNEALRLVIRLARFGAGRPPGPRDRPRPFGERSGPPRNAARGDRPSPRGPRFEE